MSPDKVVLVPSAAPDQDISVPSATMLCGCASPQPTLSQFPHQWLRSCFTFADVQQRVGACVRATAPPKIGELQCQLPRAAHCLPTWADRTMLAVSQMGRGKLKCGSLGWCIGGLPKKGSGHFLKLVGGTKWWRQWLQTDQKTRQLFKTSPNITET